MIKRELEKIQKLARRIRIQAMLSQQGEITELDSMDIDELLAQQVERALEIETLIASIAKVPLASVA